MKIRVQHEDGRMETITIKGHLEVSGGRELDRIRTENGMEQFFTKDGHYDGWAGGVSDLAHRDIEGIQIVDDSTIQ